MRLKIIVLFVLILVIGSGCDSGPSLAPFEHNAVILAFGDSLTYGTGAPKGQSYPEVLAKLLGKTVINAGIPGEVSAAGLKRLPGELNKFKPSLVILCHGGNDFLRRLDLKKTKHNLEKMVELIKSSGADIVLIGVPKLGFGLEVPKFYASIAGEYKIPYEGNILVDLLTDNNMKSDSIHPNATGYRLIAEAMHEVIVNAQK